MHVGIDGMAFAVPERFLPMDDLAHARGEDPAKYHIGLGQDEMAVAAANEDLVTFGARAAERLITDADRADIDLVLVGTESAIDESKAAAVVIHGLLGIQPFARCADITEACFGATAALHAALDHVRSHPDRAALVIASDIAKYGLHSAGEPTQGAGAVAMLIRANPRILTIEEDAVPYARDVYDFWRPFGERVPRVDGPLSKRSYIDSFTAAWQEHRRRTGLTTHDYEAMCFHLPYTKMGWKALSTLLPEHPDRPGAPARPLEGKTRGHAEALPEDARRLTLRFHQSAALSRRVGNLYTGSLYLGLISLLDAGSLRSGSHIALFSYGSGSMGEVFSGVVAQQRSNAERVSGQNASTIPAIAMPATANSRLDARRRLGISAYEAIMQSEPGRPPAGEPTGQAFTFHVDEHGIRRYKTLGAAL